MKRALVVAMCACTTSIASAQSIPKPDVTYLANIMDCEANGIGYCYGHALLKESTHYKAYFFAPANPAYRLGSPECIYVARSSTLVSTNWEVYSGATWDGPPYASSDGHPTQWVPVVCDTMATQVITAAGSGFVNAGWNSMQNQVWVTYADGPPKQLQYHLAPGGPIANHAHYGTATGVWIPPGYNARKITFDYETNYDNAKVFAGVTLPGNAIAWSNDVYGNNFGSVSLDIPSDTPWIGFGLFSKTSFTVPSSNWVFRVKNATIHYVRKPSTLVGDPAVFKHNGMYYMLYSFQEDTGGYVYGATSADGLTWSGKTVLFIGHRPSVLNDGTTVRAWYDVTPGTLMEMRTLPVSQLGSFLSPSSWSAAQIGTQRLNSGNTELLPMGTGYFVVTDGLDSTFAHHFAIDYSYTSDGLNFDPPQNLFRSTEIPPSVDAEDGPSIPQLVREGRDIYVLAGATQFVAINYKPTRRKLLYRLDPTYFAPVNAGSGYYAGGWTNMQAQMEPPAFSASNGETWITYRMKQGTSAPATGSSGTAFVPPAGKKIYKIKFDFVTNYDNALVYAGLTVPGNANFWKHDIYGNQTGSVSLELPDVDWFGLGMFTKTSFPVQASNWLFQVHNLRVYYH